jgi:NAD(P)-dependent dehydrogenase (short-subunit alcohol dehydrogenase family)
MEHLADRCAVVTGGAGGIGYSMARAFGAAGMKVAIADIDADRCDTAARDLRSEGFEAEGFAVDVTKQESMNALCRAVMFRFGDVGVLCNNAGVTILHQPFLDSAPDDWEFVFSVNVFGIVNGLRAFLPAMIASDSNHHVVNTASMSGLRPSRASSVYIASKYSVVGLTEAVSREVAQYDIAFSLLLPGAISTDLANTSKMSRDATFVEPGTSGPLDLIDSDTGPEHIGQLVVDSIRRGDFYILPQPELWPGVEQRHDSLAAAFRQANARSAESSPVSPFGRSTEPGS